MSSITFDTAKLLNENVPVSSGGETITIARLGGEEIAQIITNRDGYRVDSYEVDWFDRDESRLFDISSYRSARAALHAAKTYIRENKAQDPRTAGR